MKKLLIELLALASVSSYASNDCRTVFPEYKTKQVYERLSVDVIASGTIFRGLAVGGVAEATGALGTAATLGSAVSIGSAFVPMALYFDVEGGIALVNAPHTKAINLINQSYT